MRVLFTTFAARSHLYNMVPLAWAFLTAGHEVRVASQPDLADDTTRCGLTAVSLGAPLNLDEAYEDLPEGESFEKIGIDVAEMRPQVLTETYVQGINTVYGSLILPNIIDEETTDDLVSFARHWRPDLVIWDPLTYFGPIAAKVCGAAHARLLFGADLTGKMRNRFLDFEHRRPEPLRDDLIGEWLEWTLARYGCAVGETLEDIVLGDFTIDPMPQWLRFDLPLHTVPVRYVPCSGPAKVPDWMLREPDRTRACLTLGVSGREVVGDNVVPIGSMLEALADLDIEVVATLNADQLVSATKVPDNVRLVDYVPLNVLLPTCSVSVNHGGAGAFGTSLNHGVPQLMVPNHEWDTVMKADQVTERGFGLSLLPSDFAVDDMRDKVIRLLAEPSFKQAAERERAAVLATPSPNDIIPALEQLTAQHRS